MPLEDDVIVENRECEIVQNTGMMTTCQIHTHTRMYMCDVGCRDANPLWSLQHFREEQVSKGKNAEHLGNGEL